jgi:hypothetical protein
MKEFNIFILIGIISLIFGLSISPNINNIEFQKNYFITKSNICIFNKNNDTNPPITDIFLKGNISEHGIYTGDVEVTLNATDDLSGVNVTYYRLDTGDLIVYSESFIVTKHGNHILVYWSEDNAGNKENTNIFYITIDLYPPDINLFWHIIEGGIKFNPLVMETGSEIDRIEYYIDNILIHTSYNGNSTWIWTPDITGRHLVSAIAYDKAGHYNISEKYITIPIFNISIIGLISKLKIYPEVITFNSLIIFTDKYGPIIFGGQLLLPKFYEGYLGNFFINAEFS